MTRNKVTPCLELRLVLETRPIVRTLHPMLEANRSLHLHLYAHPMLEAYTCIPLACRTSQNSVMCMTLLL